MDRGLRVHVVTAPSLLPGTLRSFLGGDADPLAPTWVVVSSAAMRQRVEWDVSSLGEGDLAVLANVRYFFPEEFVGEIERRALAALGAPWRDWSVEAIAARLARLEGPSASWSDVLSAASELDELVRWRPDAFDATRVSASAQRLCNSEEWRTDGPLTQRARVLEALRENDVASPAHVVLYGLPSAPGGAAFVQLVAALAHSCRVDVLLAYPSRSRARVLLDQRSTEDAPVAPGGLTWWRSLDEHVQLWSAESAETHVVEAEHAGERDLDRFLAELGAPSRSSGAGGDASIRVIGGVGIARQVEQARDVVLELLEEGRAQPHDILVTGPAMDALTGHIERHWAYPHADATGRRLPRVPYELVERSRRGARTRARMIGTLLDLANDYVTVTQVEELLRFDVVSDAAGLSDLAIRRLLTLAREGHVTFGLDGARRARTLGGGVDQGDIGTWQRLLDRLALTAMMPDDLDDVEQLGTGDDLALVASVSSILRVLAAMNDEVRRQPERTVAEWLTWLAASVASLTTADAQPDDSFERALERVRRGFATTESSAVVSFDFLRDVWRHVTTSGSSASVFGRFGVHVAPLSALSGASYKYVVVVGVDEERFPPPNLRSSQLLPARTGDPNPRQAVLGALLTVIAGATQGVIMLYTSRSEINGEPVPMPVAMGEFVDFAFDAKATTSVREGSRHGFVRVRDRANEAWSYDPRYEGIADALVDAGRAGALDRARRAVMASVASPTPTKVISLAQLQRFLRDAPGHFVERGLRGAALDGVARSAPDGVRVGYDGLTAYQVRREIVERLSSLPDEGTVADAMALFNEIVARESVAADIPALLLDRRDVDNLCVTARSLRLDRRCYDQWDEAGDGALRRAIVFGDVRLELPVPSHDGRTAWLPLRDFSSRHGGTPGTPATLRFHPSTSSGPKELRESLPMLVDLLVLAVNREDPDAAPTSAIFFSYSGKKEGLNPVRGYRYVGTSSQAYDALGALVELYRRGSREPLAIGRYTTPALFEGVDIKKSYLEDTKDPTFRVIQPAFVDDFVALGKEQGVRAVFEEIYARTQWCRETSSRRKGSERVGVEDPAALTSYQTMDAGAHQ